MENSQNQPQNQPEEEVYGRRSFLKRAAATIAAFAVPSIVSGCQNPEYDCRVDPQHSIKEVTRDTKYGEILASYPNLSKAVDYLRSIKSEGMDGYDAMMELLKNGYNPVNGLQSTEQTVTEWMKKHPRLSAPEKQYILTVAQSLYIEANQLVPWSLRDYSEEEIEGLFYVSRFQGAGSECKSLPEDVPVNGMLYGSEQVELETSYKMLALAMKLKGQNQEETVINLIRFVKSNFTHTYSDWYTDREWGFEVYGENKVPDNLEQLFEERLGGCREPSMVLNGLLRALNIPSFLMETPENLYHGGVYLPALKKFVHGDHLAAFEHLAPSDLLLLDLGEMEGKMANDGMLYDHIDAKVSERFNGDKSVIFLNAWIFRDENAIGLRIDGEYPPSPAIFETMQRECPQYNIRLDGDGKMKSDFIPIKSLKEFSDPETDVWS